MDGHPTNPGHTIDLFHAIVKFTQPTKTACNMNASFRLAQCHAKMKCFSEAVAALDRSVETLEANPAVEPRCSIRLETFDPEFQPNVF